MVLESDWRLCRSREPRLHRDIQQGRDRDLARRRPRRRRGGPVTSRWTGFQSALGPRLEAFLAQKRALGCRFRNEESPLRLLDRFLVEQHIETNDDITPAVIDAFLASRPRASPHSYNQLLGIVTRLFDWLVAHD